MNRGKKQIRSTKLQLAKLMECMRNDKMLANREYGGPLGIRRLNAKWFRLTNLLNGLGPNKTVEQWKQTWRDLRRKFRKENMIANSGESSNNNDNSPLSENVARILEHASSNGVGPKASEISQRVSILFDGSNVPTEVIEYDHNDVVLEPKPNLNGKKKSNGITEALSSNHFLALQEDHNLLLTRICCLMEEANTLRKEKNNLLQEQIRLTKRRRGNNSNQTKLSF